MSEAWFLPAGEGQTITVPGIGIDMRVLVPAARADGEFCLILERTAPGGGPPLHIHHRQTETFHILDGTYELAIGERRFTAGPGDVAVVPRGAPHAFRNIGAGPARLLFMLSPALAGERFFEEFAALAAKGPPDPAALNAFAAPFDLEFVGPPLGATPAP